MPKLCAMKSFIGPAPMHLCQMVVVLSPAETRCAYICVLNLESKRLWEKLWENVFPIDPISLTENSSLLLIQSSLKIVDVEMH